MNTHPITRPPTLRQREILNYATTYTNWHKHFPSTRTIQLFFLFKSQNSVICHLNALVRRRLLNHEKGGYSLPTQTR